MFTLTDSRNSVKVAPHSTVVLSHVLVIIREK